MKNKNEKTAEQNEIKEVVEKYRFAWIAAAINGAIVGVAYMIGREYAMLRLSTGLKRYCEANPNLKEELVKAAEILKNSK